MGFGFGDEVFWGFLEVVGVGEAEVEGVDFFAEGEDAVFEVFAMGFELVVGDIEVDFVVGDG